MPDPDADLSSCGQPSQLPDPQIVSLAESMAEPLANLLRSITWRDGWLLRHEAAIAEVASHLQPMDIILVSSNHRLSGTIANSYLTHAVLVLGSEDDLRDLGLWDDPLIQPLQPTIHAGAILIEANGAAVGLSALETVLNADGAVVLRPDQVSAAEIRLAVRRAAAQFGQPFDFAFDAESQDAVFCTELIDRALPGVSLPRVALLGRATIVPDDVASAALDGESSLFLVTFIHADRNGWAIGSADLLRATIAANWPRL